MLSEGVYRRSGVQSKVHRLLNALQANAWNVHISKEDYSEHDVTVRAPDWSMVDRRPIRNCFVVRFVSDASTA